MDRFGIFFIEIAYYAFLLYGFAFGVAGIVRRKIVVKHGSLVQGWKAVIAGCFVIVMVVFLAILVGELLCFFEI